MRCGDGVDAGLGGAGDGAGRGGRRLRRPLRGPPATRLPLGPAALRWRAAAGRGRVERGVHPRVPQVARRARRRLRPVPAPGGGQRGQAHVHPPRPPTEERAAPRPRRRDPGVARGPGRAPPARVVGAPDPAREAAHCVRPSLLRGAPRRGSGRGHGHLAGDGEVPSLPRARTPAGPLGGTAVTFHDDFDDRMTDEMQRMVEGTDASDLVRTRIERGLQEPRTMPRGLILWGSIAAAVAALIALAVAPSSGGKKQNVAAGLLASTTTQPDEGVGSAGSDGAGVGPGAASNAAPGASRITTSVRHVAATTVPVKTTTTTVSGGPPPSGPHITEFPLPQGASPPNDIAAGPDGNMWFAEAFFGKVGGVMPRGTVTERRQASAAGH